MDNLRNCEPQTLQKNKKPNPQIQLKVPYKKNKTCAIDKASNRITKIIAMIYGPENNLKPLPQLYLLLSRKQCHR